PPWPPGSPTRRGCWPPRRAKASCYKLYSTHGFLCTALDGESSVSRQLEGDRRTTEQALREEGEDAGALTPADLRKKIRAVDKKRARYYLFYTNQAWGKKENYDLCINTSRYASIKAWVPGLDRKSVV